MRRILYVVGCLKENLTVRSLNSPIVIEAPCSWAQGMCGAFPAFWDRKDAEAYQVSMGGGYPIEEFEVDTPTLQ